MYIDGLILSLSPISYKFPFTAFFLFHLFMHVQKQNSVSIDKDPSIFAARHHPLIVLEKECIKEGGWMGGWKRERERERECVCV
jgi:hypothetical protein